MPNVQRKGSRLAVAECSDRGLQAMVSSMRRMIGAKMMKITNSSITNLDPLKACLGLEVLDLSGCMHIESLAALQSGGRKLQALRLSNTNVSDLSCLAGLEIVHLELCNCQGVTDISPLRHCLNLKYLNIEGTNVASLGSLEKIPALKVCTVPNGKKIRRSDS